MLFADSIQRRKLWGNFYYVVIGRVWKQSAILFLMKIGFIGV